MAKSKIDTNIQPQRKYSSVKKIVNYVTILLLAASLGYIHYKYVSNLFENDRNFSYLSELEREMSFRTEMGFYYSYYKTIVEENPFIAGISKLMYDKHVEYPDEVNAFNRFNIHPEVLIGSMYRYFEPWLNTTSHRQCHMVDRGGGLPLVESCVGLGQPVFFYLEAIWWLAGLTVAALFLQAFTLSESALGGLVCVAQYFANHSECTRVQWAPNQRENFAAPLLVLQAWLVSLQLRDKDRRTTFQLQVSIFILNCLCLLSWQFTQFIFLAQTAIFFMMEQLRIIDIKSLCIFLYSHLCGLHMAILLLQKNDMLQTSLYASFFLVVFAYCLLFSSLRIKVQNRLDFLVEAWLVLLRVCLVTCSAVYLKKGLSDYLEVHEDSHVWDILFSKFSDFKTFHTLLYTCSDVFDFLPWSTYKKLLNSFLMPYAVVAVINVCNHWARAASARGRSETQKKPAQMERDGNTDEETDDSGIENSAETKATATNNDLDSICMDIKSGIERQGGDKLVSFLTHFHVEPAIFYNVSQLAVYAVMAAVVMRLKLLFVTQMCVVSSLIMNSKYYALPKSYMKLLPLFWAIILLPLGQHIYQNVSEEMSHKGEFSDMPQEQLLQWIRRETGAGAAFAGSMPVLAAVLLAARRPVVAHPHYEHVHARERAYSVYKTYGRFTPLELYQELSKLKATYLIVETKYCYGRSSKGCSFEDIWDVETPSLRHQPPLCRTLLSSHVDHFYPVFRNEQYAVYRIHDYSVRYMPRSFDT